LIIQTIIVILNNSKTSKINLDQARGLLAFMLDQEGLRVRRAVGQEGGAGG